jgi:CRISPR-associated protein Cmr4
MAVSLLFVHALTSIHAGTGQGVGTIDLPIARERATNLPVIPGSTLKGCLRDSFKGRPTAEIERVFGKSDAQGSLRISDARLLLLPVRSLGTTFVWATCPYVLRRFLRDCELAQAQPPVGMPNPTDNEADVADREAAITVGGKLRLVLEDLDFGIQQTAAKAWAEWLADRIFPAQADWRTEFLKRLVVLSDANFDYLCEFATEVNAHIKIDDKTGTVVRGALWYEETLPAETVLISVLEDTSDIQDLIPGALRLGGNATTGQGLARLVVAGGT